MPFIEVDDQPIFYTHHRASVGPPLVLVHGAGGSHLHWPPQLRRLKDQSVISLDLPGHGRSSGSGCRTVEEYARFLATFVNAVGLENFVLAGHSMGGAIALAYAASHQDRLAGLALIASGARLPVAPALLVGLKNDFSAATQWITEMAYCDQTSAATKRLSLNRLREADPGTLYDDFAACDRCDGREELATIKTPTLIACGKQDRMAPVRYSQQLQAELPNSDLHLVENAGHMVMLEQPAEIVSIFETYLQSLSTGSS